MEKLSAQAKAFQPGTCAHFDATFRGLGMADQNDMPVLAVKNIHGGGAGDFAFTEDVPSDVQASDVVAPPVTPSRSRKRAPSASPPGDHHPQDLEHQSTPTPRKPIKVEKGVSSTANSSKRQRIEGNTNAAAGSSTGKQPARVTLPRTIGRTVAFKPVPVEPDNADLSQSQDEDPAPQRH